MKSNAVLLYLELASIVHAASDAPRPRGVGPEFAKYYKDSKIFACISKPSVKLPFSRVNDDYCDCEDGSDEPGTSACANLSPSSPQTPDNVNLTVALPGFYCKNKGHVPSYVPFTSVNDGVCDYDLCCDGSEEWESIGGVKCEDRCNQIGKEFRKQDAARQKSVQSAVKKRKELVEQAARMRKEVEDRIKTLGTEIQGAEVKVKGMEAELADARKKDKGKVIKPSTGSKGGKLGVLVSLTRERIDELKDNLMRVREERDSSRGRVQELEELLTTFKEEYNPNFNDEGVKRAVRAWEDYAARDKGPDLEPARERDLDEIVRTDEDNGIDWADYEGEDESDTDVLYAFENYLPPSLRDWIDTKLRELRVTLIEAGILADKGDSSNESKAVSDARSRLSTAERDLENMRKDLESRREELSTDYGPDDVFRALKDTCVSTDSGEYTYEVCFMSKTTQKPKKGGGHTNMGSFARLEKIMVDDAPRADGKGLGSGERIAMKHEGGQHCWNGPNRSTTVILACAEENEVWKIMEEEKCVYRMEVGTPAVCEALGGGATDGQVKDEL